jgi:hypothetical protein
VSSIHEKAALLHPAVFFYMIPKKAMSQVVYVKVAGKIMAG